MKKIEQWTQEKIIKIPTELKLKEYKLWKKEIHYNATANNKNIVIETYSKGPWNKESDIHHIYESEEI